MKSEVVIIKWRKVRAAVFEKNICSLPYYLLYDVLLLLLLLLLLMLMLMLMVLLMLMLMLLLLLT
jgi:hypothetical protein